MEQTDKKERTQHHVWGVAATILFHGLLLLLFIFLVFHTPIPPWPEEGGGGGGSGLEINLGNSDDGMGTDQYADISIPSFANNKAPEPVVAPQEDENQANTQAEDVLTQDNEESVSVPSKTDNPKKKTDTKTVVKQPEQKVVVPQPVVNKNALYKKNKNTNDGTTGKQGNQGREDGTTSSGKYGGTGSGQGTGNGTGTGSGTGSGSGSGTGGGKGSGTGDGVSPNLDYRRRTLETPIYNSPEQGKIVVSIKVNKQGKVTYAKAIAKGSTITEIGLQQQAEKAALASVFAPDENAPDEQRGTITYNFKKVK